MSSIPTEIFEPRTTQMPAGPASQSRKEKASPQSRPAPGVTARQRVRSAKHAPRIPPATTPATGNKLTTASAAAPTEPMIAPINKRNAQDFMGSVFLGTDEHRSSGQYRAERTTRWSNR